jgi:hypothetical protein
MTSCKTLRVASLILSNSSIQQTPPSDRTKAPLQWTLGQLGIRRTRWLANLPFQYELLRIRISCDVRRKTDRRGPLSGSVDPSRRNFVNILRARNG